MALWKEWAAGLGLLLAASPRTHCMPGTEWKQCLLALLPWTHDSMQAVWWVETWTGSMKPEGTDLLQIKNSSFRGAHMPVSINKGFPTEVRTYYLGSLYSVSFFHTLMCTWKWVPQRHCFTQEIKQLGQSNSDLISEELLTYFTVR